MIRSMYSGISGIKANQTKLDVIGNNIANVGTTAYKGQRTRFQDMLNHTLKDSMGTSEDLGGSNATQVGLGVQLSGVDTSMTQGNMQSTGGTLDTAIDGNGFFVVERGSLTADPIEIDRDSDTIENLPTGIKLLYTRDGSFKLDESSNLVNSSGMRVMGYAIDGDSIAYEDGIAKATFKDADTTFEVTEGTLIPLAIPDTVDYEGTTVRVKSFTIDESGVIRAVLDNNKTTVLGQVAMASFKNPEGMKKLGGNLWENSLNSGEAVYRNGVGVEDSNKSSYGNIIQGMLEMSNVDLAEQFSDMIVASRAFQANGKIVTTSDEILDNLINLKR